MKQLKNSVRQKNGKWLNTKVFREASLNFMKHGHYCTFPWGSPDWFNYWKEERKKCLNGYEVDGNKITGDHYFYLNYCPIEKVDLESAVGKIASKITGFPDFWDGDYNYFWIRNIARNGILESLNVSIKEQKRILKLDKKEKIILLKKYYKKLGLIYKPTDNSLEGGLDIILGKARRRGFSHKNASIAVGNYFHRPKSYTMLIAYEKKYLYPGKKTIFGKCQDYINFINDNTGWIMPSDSINKNNHIKASYKEYKEGVEIEKGFLSEIEAISFKDNPHSGRGANIYDIMGEEVGAWGTPGGLKASIEAMRASSEAGFYKTGLMTLFGTSGSMEKGTIDFADLFNNPEANNFISFYDIWGKIKEKVEGFFFPKNLNTEGFYDINGNSNLETAKEFELEVRKKLIDKGATSGAIQKRMQEEPLDSAEAFSMIASNTFPVVELKAQLVKVQANKLQEIKGTPIKFYLDKGDVKAKPILDGSASPIVSYNSIPEDKKGCPIIYEYPVDNPPRGLYKIGYDPIRQDDGTSLAAIIVYKGVHLGTVYHSVIVAEYIGRKETSEDIDRIAESFSDLYNTQIMYENEVTGVKNYFRRIKRLNLLAAQPDAVISKNIKNSRVARVYGCHMNLQLKDAGERYVKDWLLTTLDYDENGSPIKTIDRIYSIRLLEELILYNRKGNFDLVSSLFMCMFQVQEEELGKEYSHNNINKNAKNLIKMIDKMYKNN